MVTVMKSLKKFIASMLVVLMMFVQFPFAAIAEEIENANNDEVQTAESSEGTGNEENNEGEEGENPEANDDEEEPPFQTREATRGGDEIEYGEGFKVGIRWGGTSNKQYTWNSVKSEGKVIKLMFYYQNEVSPKAYDVGELRVTVPGIGKLNRSSTKKASDIAADVYGAEEIKRDWSYTYNAETDMYTFYNNHAIELGETFNGAFELVYEFSSRDCVNGYDQDIQAVLYDGENYFYTQNLNLKFTSLGDTFYIRKTANAIRRVDGFESYAAEGKSASDYAWVQYNFVYNVQEMNARALKTRYVEDILPEGCVIVGNNYTQNPDGTISYKIIESTVPENNVRNVSVIVGYPEEYANEQITNTAYLYGVYKDETEPTLLAQDSVDILLEKAASEMITIIPGKTITPNTVYNDSYTGVINFTSTLKATATASPDNGQKYSIIMTDNLIEMCQSDGTMHTLLGDEYKFTKVVIPGKNNFKNGNDYTISDGNYTANIYALYAEDYQNGDVSEYTKVYEGAWNNNNITKDLTGNVMAVRVEICGLTETINNFYISINGTIDVSQKNYGIPQYFINYCETDIVDIYGGRLIPMALSSYATIRITTRPINYGSYSAECSMSGFSLKDNAYSTKLNHSISVNNARRESIEKLEIHGITDQSTVEEILDSLTFTSSGLSFTNEIPQDKTVEQYLREHATISKDGNEISVYFDFTENPINSTSFNISFNVDANLQTIPDKNSTYSARTFSYINDTLMVPQNTATHNEKTMATRTDSVNLILGYYYADCEMTPFYLDEDCEYFCTSITHKARIDNRAKTGISKLRIYGVTEKEQLKEYINSIQFTYSGLKFRNELPSEVNIDEYLWSRVNFEQDGNEVIAYFDFSDNPIVSSNFTLGFIIDGKISYEDYYNEVNLVYPTKTYAYMEDATLAPQSTATYHDETMAIDRTYRSMLLAISSHQQLLKLVKTDYSGEFVDEDAVTTMQEEYTYRLRFRNGFNTITEMEFVDIIEHAELTEVENDYPYHESEWYGAFKNVDTSKLEENGLTPIVYYANTLTPDDNSWTIMESHQDGIWTTQNSVKAIKVYIDSEIAENSIVYVDINMESPYDVNLVDKKAYNSYTMSCEAVDLYTGIKSTYMENMPSNEVDVRLAEKEYKLEITKTDTVSGTKLNGAVFGLYDSNGTLISTDITSMLGVAPFKNLKAGTYTIKEEVTPVGYKKVNDYTLTINPDGTYTVDNIEEINTTENLTFTSEGSYAWTQNEDGTWQSNNYNVNSTTALMTSNEFTLESAGTISFDWSVSSQGTSYDYLYYTIKNAQTGATISGTGTSTKIGGTTRGTVYENLAYDHVEKELPAGTYTIEYRYYKNGSTHTGLDRGFVKNAKIKYVHSEPRQQSGTATDINNVPTIKFEASNQKEKGKLTVHKIDEYKNSNKAEQPLSGVTFNLVDHNRNIVDTGTTDSNGNIVFNDLDWGEVYTLEETEAKQGYEIATQTAYISKTNLNATTVVENIRKKGTVTLTKQDEKNAAKLDGAKYGLYADNDIYDKDGEIVIEKDELIGQKTTNEDGQVSFDNLLWGDYYFKELETVYGYELSEEKYTFTVSSSNVEETISLIVNEERSKAKLQLIKIDSNGNFLPGAEIGLFRKDSNDILNNSYDVELTSEGQYPWTQNEDGTWQSTNNGKANSESIITSNEFTLEKDGNLVFEWSVSSQSNTTDYAYYTITNTETGETFGGESTKIDGTTRGTSYESLVFDTASQSLKKGTYTLEVKYLKNASTNSGLDRAYIRNVKYIEPKSVISDNNGQINIEDIEWGEYYIKEINPPDGYELDNTMYSFEVNRETFANNNNSVTVVTNETTSDTTSVLSNTKKLGKVTLTKYECDASGNETNTVLPDAVYELYKANGEIVGEYTTNSEGKIVVENLDWNSYYFLEKEAPTGFSTSDKKISFVINSRNVSFEQEVSAYDKRESGEITINKEISADSIQATHGNSSFMFKIVGKDNNNQEQVTLHRTITFSEEDKANADINGNVRKTIKISELNPYLYEITEEENYRYVLNSITPVSTNASSSGNVGTIDLLSTGLNKGEITFNNIKTTNSNLTHNELIANTAQSEFYLIGFGATTKQSEYPIGTVLTGDDFNYVLYYSGGQEVPVNTLTGITINGEQSYTQENTGYYLVDVEYTDAGKTYTSEVQTKWVMPSDYFTYTTNNDGTINITGINTKYTSPEVLYIPSEVNGKRVKQVGGTVANNSNKLSNIANVKTVQIADGVESIGDFAFYQCRNITSIDLPDTLTSIRRDAFEGCSSLTSIEIPEGVTSIGDLAFSGCSSLTSIDLPDTLTSIGSSAFYNCTNLSSIDLPDTLTSIGTSTFRGCTSLTSIDLPDTLTSIGNTAFYNCTNLTSIEIPEGVTSIGNSAFYGCRRLTSIEIPEGVTSIGNSAFSGCSSLTSIDLPDTLTSIGHSAFYDCKSLTSIEIPEGVTSISNNTFYYCTNLSSIDIPDTLTSIGDGTFRGCSSLTSIDLPDTVTSIGTSAFQSCSSLTSVDLSNTQIISIGAGAFSGCSSLTSVDLSNTQITSIEGETFNGCIGLTSIDLPDTLTSIGHSAFYGCSSLTSIEIPEGVTSIGNNAFNQCSRLTSVDLSNTQLTTIGTSAFNSCSNLTSIDLPDTLTSIANSAFYKCSKLTSIEIPEGVTSISNNTFYNCTNLSSIDIPDTLTSIGSYAFYGCSSLTSIEIPEGVTSIGKDAFYKCNSLTSIDVDSNNTNYCSVDGVLFNKDKTTLIKYPEGKNDITTYVVPSTVTRIELSAFYNCSGLINVDLSNTQITSIEPSTFSNCTGLTSIEIPEGVTSIGDNAFISCSSLTSIDLSNTQVTSIGKYAFDGCRSLTSIDLSNTQLTSIERDAFEGCRSLTSIYLPDTVTSIENGAFEGCSCLTDVYYTGTQEQFSAITIGNGNTHFVNAQKHYNYVP